MDGSTEKLEVLEFNQIILHLEKKIFLINDFIIEELGKRYPPIHVEVHDMDKQEAS